MKVDGIVNAHQRSPDGGSWLVQLSSPMPTRNAAPLASVVTPSPTAGVGRTPASPLPPPVPGRASK